MTLSSTHAPPETEQLFRLPEVLARVPVSRATWYRGIKDGRFPKPIKLGKQTNVWRASEVAKVIQNGAEISA